MRKFAEWIDRHFLLNPWLSRAGNVGMALVIAGLVGGLVATALNFPTIPMLTTMLGAFLLVLRGVQMAALSVRPGLRTRQIGEECLEVVDELTTFLDERDKDDPHGNVLARIIREGKRGAAAGTAGEKPKPDFAQMYEEIQYTSETREQYEAKFAGRVFKLVTDLQDRGLLTEKEAQRLNYPKDQNGRRKVVTRLRECGRRLT